MAEQVVGTVITTDKVGNLLTDITAEQLQHAPNDERVTIACGGHQTYGIFPRDHNQPEMTLLAMFGAGDHLELILVGESAHKFLGIDVGEQVLVKW